MYIKKTLLLGFLATFLGAAWGAPEEPPKKNWNNKAEVSFVNTNGNTDTSSLAAEDTHKHKWKKALLTLNGAALKNESNGTTDAERYRASEQFNFDISKRNYVFERFKWNKDRFEDINHRYDFNAGLGRKLLEFEKHKLLGELGAGHVYEDRISVADKEYASGRAYGKYKWIWSETSDFSQDVEYIHNFDDRQAYRLNTHTSVTSKISTYLSLKISYELKRNNDPSPGIKKNDTITRMVLVFDY